MRRLIKLSAILAVMGVVMPFTVTALTAAESLPIQILKGAAVGYGITRVSKQLDQFINAATLRSGMQTKMATKVVPILSVGEKGYIGGAQVCGPAAYVKKVQAVLQYEQNFSNNNYRAKILVPNASLNPLNLKRVPKVGVTAIIDISLDGAQRYNTIGTGIQTNDVIRGAAVLIAVKNFGKEINKGLNALTFNIGSGYTTKVVPMASFGEKAYLGAAQISGSTSTTQKVNALWQYEGLFDHGRYRVKIMVPTNSYNPLEMRRVDGAGLSALVDIALSEQKDIPKPHQSSRGGILDRVFQRSGGASAPQIPQCNPRVELPRHDNGKHKGWYIGKHKGWYKNGKAEERERD